MPLITRFEDLHAWQEARSLTKLIYSYCSEGTFARDYGLRDQIQRAAISTMANIAEGFDCSSKSEFARFLSFARRSAVEVQSSLYAALDAGYLTKPQFETGYAQAEKTKALIGGLISSIKKRHDT